MTGYFQRMHQHFQHQTPKSLQFSSFFATPYVKAIKGQNQYAPKIDSYSLLSPSEITMLQQIVYGFLYYARAIDNTLLPSLNTISEKQAAATIKTADQCHRVLD